MELILVTLVGGALSNDRNDGSGSGGAGSTDEDGDAGLSNGRSDSNSPGPQYEDGQARLTKCDVTVKG